ncbi:uncharacterized protein DUF5017 [Dyadobacter jejuensis]|uniref:Uncharacterized protein DUF5017 n=1 Tax=Dyadobacter jejuensis TaxID=1082580 RepID=A0A316B534_9BACT|nr:DUF5017 domain-containing protein [Dyadobacter jejuensis]PWJ57747.1 uncharacterized protein DUF5017 [Dyadobacter jejuensis]
MKNILKITMAVASLTVGACSVDKVALPELQVTTEKVSYKVGEVVNFNFEGNPDRIYFFSGELGKRHEFAGRATADGTPQLQFSTLRENGKQEGSLRLMLSTDFPGITVGDYEATQKSITEASWTDITGPATLSTGTKVSSGALDLSEYAQEGQPVFIGFKYLATPGSIQNKWTISDLTLKNVLSDGTSYTLANMTNTAISNYGVSTNYSPGWASYWISSGYTWGLSSNRLIITGATSAANATLPAESWTLMGPVDLTKVTPDVGQHLKGLDTRLENYEYSYSAPGTYNATFVAASTNVYGDREVVRTVQITITE